MIELIEFLKETLSRSQKKQYEYAERITRLTTLVVELCHKDVTDEFKQLVKSEILQNGNIDF